jgi:hypothetical protein
MWLPTCLKGSSTDNCRSEWIGSPDSGLLPAAPGRIFYHLEALFASKIKYAWDVMYLEAIIQIDISAV